MILVIGGAYQGKREFIKRRWGIKDCEITDLAESKSCAEERTCPLKKSSRDEECSSGSITRSHGIICENHAAINYQELIRAQIQHSLDPEEELHRLVRDNPDIIICSNEVGMGIIPLERSDRVYRETVGRTMCAAAAMADEVWRVICGIGERIK